MKGPHDDDFSVFEMLSKVPSEKVRHYYPADDSDELFLSSVFEGVDKWIDNSKKRPDVLNHSYGFMLEVMRVNDTARKGDRNPKSEINQRLSAENDFRKEISKNGYLSDTARASDVFVSAGVGVPTYGQYLQNIESVLVGHANKVSAYRAKHPDYKLGFLVLDESDSFYYTPLDSVPEQVGGCSAVRSFGPHYELLDHNIVSLLQGMDIDYLLWMSPYKHSFGIIDGQNCYLDRPAVWFFSRLGLVDLLSELEPLPEGQRVISVEHFIEDDYETEPIAFLREKDLSPSLLRFLQADREVLGGNSPPTEQSNRGSARRKRRKVQVSSRRRNRKSKKGNK